MNRTGPSVRKPRGTSPWVIAALVLATLIVIGVFVLIAVGISTGEQQSHEWAGQVATAYAAAKSGAPESVVRGQLGDPFTVRKHVLASDPAADVRCLIYRVLLPTVELVPYHFCYTHHRLVTKYRGWDNIPDED